MKVIPEKQNIRYLRFLIKDVPTLNFEIVLVQNKIKQYKMDT